MRERGKRNNQEKLRIDLITPQIEEAIAKVLTDGASIYGDRNWEKGMLWTEVYASLRRHLLAFIKGEDYDESGNLHIDHVLTNAGILSTYYRTRPEFDNRLTLHKKIALDIDGVIADFKTAYCERRNIKPQNNHWHFTYMWKKEDDIFDDHDFWVNQIHPLINGADLLFEPVCYVTSRRCPVEWTMEWLEKHGFPCEKVYSGQNDKRKVLKNLFNNGEIDIFVDDAYKHFVSLNEAGVPTFLFSKPYNEKYDVGYKRIKSLNDLML